MEIIKKRINQPGTYEITIPFEKKGEEKEWTGTVDARTAGEYKLKVTGWHKSMDTKGKITIRGVVGKGAYLDVAGLIKIEKEAQQTDNFLEIRIMLIDKTAKANAEPKLEIEADNVKAGHAASVGKMDEEQITYLMSRGLTREKAEEAITASFLGESDKIE